MIADLNQAGMVGERFLGAVLTHCGNISLLALLMRLRPCLAQRCSRANEAG